MSMCSQQHPFSARPNTNDLQGSYSSPFIDNRTWQYAVLMMGDAVIIDTVIMLDAMMLGCYGFKVQEVKCYKINVIMKL